METKQFYITFGVQYGSPEDGKIEHPQGMDGNGYAVIEVPYPNDERIHEADLPSVMERKAREIAFALFADRWAMLRDETPSREFAPYGELVRFGVHPSQRGLTAPQESARINSMVDSMIRDTPFAREDFDASQIEKLTTAASELYLLAHAPVAS